MPTTAKDIHEASDINSGLSVEIFKAWLKAEPGYDWRIAEVDRFDGLTLTSSDGRSALHFQSALCGYPGSGPGATVEILVLGGFGTKESLQELVYGNVHYTFQRHG